MKNFATTLLLASAGLVASSPLGAFNLKALREHMLEQNYTLPYIPYEGVFNATINQIAGIGFYTIGQEFGQFSSALNEQITHFYIDTGAYNFSQHTVVNLNNHTVTGW